MSITYPDLEKLKKALREEDLTHSSITFEKIRRIGPDAFFECRIVTKEGRQDFDKASNYFVHTDFTIVEAGYFKCPANLDAVALYSRRAYKYPVVSFRLKLPQLSGLPAGSSVYFGFENGGGAGNGCAFFRWYTPDGRSERLDVHAGGHFWWYTVEITNLIDTSWHKQNFTDFNVQVMRNLIEFSVISEVRAFAIPTNVHAALPDPIPGPPYAILFVREPIPASFNVLLEVAGEGAELEVPISWWGLRVSDGPEISPRRLLLYQYQTSNKMPGTTLDSGSIVSHPVPVAGFNSKTFYFMADQAGTVEIQVYTLTGNWRTYYSDTVSANELWWFKMTGDAVIARLVYTPSSYPATIHEAEVVLSG